MPKSITKILFTIACSLARKRLVLWLNNPDHRDSIEVNPSAVLPQVLI